MEFGNHKVYIEVSFGDKAVAKSMGAKWDNNRKQWYAITTSPHFDYIIHHFKPWKRTIKVYADEDLDTIKKGYVDDYNELNLEFIVLSTNKGCCEKCGKKYSVACSVNCYNRE